MEESEGEVSGSIKSEQQRASQQRLANHIHNRGKGWNEPKGRYYVHALGDVCAEK